MSEAQIELNPGSGGALSATFSDASNRHHQEVVIQTQTGSSDPVTVNGSNPLPVTGTVAVSGTTAVSGSVSVTGTISAVGNVASNAPESGNPIGVAGVYNSSPPTFTSGNRASLQTDVNGFLKVNIAAGAAAGGTSSSVAAAVPSTATAAGFSDGTNLQIARVFDVDSGGGTQYVQGVSLRGSGSGGSVELGVAANPIVVGGAVAAGVASSGNPVPMAGIYLSAAPTYANGQSAALQTDASGNLKVNIQSGGGSGGTASSFGSAVPASGTAVGFSDGTNMQAARVFDLDTGGGTQYIQGVSLRTGGSGGSVEIGVAATPLIVAGNVASGSTDSGSPVKVGGIYNSTPVTLTNGQRGDLQLDANGYLKINLATGGISAFQDNTGFTPNTTTGLNIMAEVDDTGTTNVSENNAGALRMTPARSLHVAARDSSGADATDTSVAAIKVVATPSASIGATPGHLISTATTNATSVKGSAGSLHMLHAINNHASSIRYLKLYNKSTSPTVGTDTPVLTFGIPPGGGFNLPMAVKFTSGIGFAITSGIADLDTGAIGASEVAVSYAYA